MTPSPHTPADGGAKTKRENDERRSICTEIQALEDRAMRAGLPITSRGLNNAKNAWGWEISGNIAKAAASIRNSR